MKRILVVEDDRPVADSLVLCLEVAGYEVRKAGDAAVGCMAATSMRPDLVILDISLPAGSGFRVCEHMRAKPELADTPVIFMTAFSNPRLKERAEELGAVGFLHKPYDVDELLASVRRALGEDEPDS